MEASCSQIILCLCLDSVVDKTFDAFRKERLVAVEALIGIAYAVLALALDSLLQNPVQSIMTATVLTLSTVFFAAMRQ